MKKKHNRNKLPLVLAALLTLSLIAYGSFAYFSSSQTVKPDLELDLGHIVVTAESKNWKYMTEPENVNKQLKDDKGTLLDLNSESDIPADGGMTTVNNVQPGDKFTRDITFTLDTTLDTMVKITNNIKNDTEGPYKVSIEYKDLIVDGQGRPVDPAWNNHFDKKDMEEFPVTPSKKSVTATVAVEVLADESYNTNSTKKEKSLNEVIENWAKKAITVEAVQENYADENF